MLTDSAAARLALLVVYAMDQFHADPTNLTPAEDPRVAQDGWKIAGYLTASDALLFPQKAIDFGDDVCYGFLAQSISDPTCFAVAIRGTGDLLEWIEDAEFLPARHPEAGTVESGFWSIYESLTYRSGDNPPVRAVQGIAAAVGGGRVTVLGHSLGAPLATYLSFDLGSSALLGDRVSAALFASPRPGNDQFVRAFDARVPNYQLWNYELDVVPHVPRGSDYADLPRVNWIGIGYSQAAISFSIACHHRLLSYCAMLDYTLLDWSALPEAKDCIKGPT